MLLSIRRLIRNAQSFGRAFRGRARRANGPVVSRLVKCRIEISSNAGERAMRPIAPTRKMHCSGAFVRAMGKSFGCLRLCNAPTRPGIRLAATLPPVCGQVAGFSHFLNPPCPFVDRASERTSAGAQPARQGMHTSQKSLKSNGSFLSTPGARQERASGMTGSGSPSLFPA